MKKIINNQIEVTPDTNDHTKPYQELFDYIIQEFEKIPLLDSMKDLINICARVKLALEETKTTSNRGGLEEAAREYAISINGSVYIRYANTDFKAGAKWQQSQVKQATCTHENTVWENQGFTLYCRDCKTSIDDKTSQVKPVKTLQECKDEVASNHGYNDWKNLLFSQLIFSKVLKCFDEVAELYASQVKITH